jgi:hypothetical protein
VRSQTEFGNEGHEGKRGKRGKAAAMRLTFQHNLGDILEANCACREQRIKGWLGTLFGVGLMLTGVVASFQDSQRDQTPVFISAAMFVLIGLFATRIAGLGAWYSKAQRSPFEIEVAAEGIAFITHHEPALLEWQSFSRWFRTKNLLALVTCGDALVIPKRSLDETQWQELLALVRSNLGNPARW